MAVPSSAADDLPAVPLSPGTGRGRTWIALREIRAVFVRRRGFLLGTVGALLALCTIYCALTPRVYEAEARVSLRATPVSALAASPDIPQHALGTSDTQVETLANLLRSDQVAWRVVTGQKLYANPAFARDFARRFPGFSADAPDPGAQAWLLERFQHALLVRTLPRTTIVQIRFRAADPVLAAAVANALVHAYAAQQTAARVAATADSTQDVTRQLADLKSRIDAESRRLAEFQKQNGLIDTPQTIAAGQTSEVQHNPELVEIDELSRELVEARADRILRQTQYLAALRSGPESVLASDPRLQTQNAGFATAVLSQLHTQQSLLEQEASQLSTEHGPNFPRVVEIRAQRADIDRQLAAQDKRLINLFHGAWKAAADREQMLEQSLQASTERGMQINSAAATYAAMRQQVDRDQELYLTMHSRAEEAGLTASLESSNIEVVDWARLPLRPVRPNWIVALAVTFFVASWIAIAGAFLLESLASSAVAALLLLCAAGAAVAGAQAPTPSTSGLPTGVAHVPLTHETRPAPNPADAPVTWGADSRASADGAAAPQPMAASIGPGDVLDVSEFHVPEFHARVRVSNTGDVVLSMIGQIALTGMDESAAARAIESALVSKGILLHPQVTVMVVSYAGQDVTVLGEVTRPGVYPYSVHHQLLDLVSAASGFTPVAGRLVTVTHRDASRAPQAIVLDGASGNQNPELLAGDTVEVHRAGLIYVIGDVMRPGGFPVDPRQKLTVLQALTLAWGPTQNAKLTHALLIREQPDGRTVTTLNLKRLLRGQDPDLPAQDRDILFVPDSTAKNLWNRTAESVIQSAAGVSIYAGLVYSQRF